MTTLNNNGLVIPKQNLGNVTPGASDDGRLYNHDGSSSISLTDGTTTSASGYYQWVNSSSTWNPLKYSGTASEFVSKSGDSMSGILDMTGNNIVGMNKIIGTNSNDVIEFADGALIIKQDLNNLDSQYTVAKFLDSRNVEIPNGSVAALDGFVHGSQSMKDFRIYWNVDDPGPAIQNFASDTPHFIVRDTNGNTQLRVLNNGNLRIPSGDITDGTNVVYDSVNAYVPSARVQGLDNHTSNTSNPHSVTASQAGALPDTGGAMTGNVDMNGNYIDNRTGYLCGYLSTAQSGANNGHYVNTFENREVNDGPYTVDSSSQITVNRAGRYRINFSCSWDQTGGGSRTSMQVYPELAGVKRQEFRVTCYIRNATSGDRSGCSNEVVTSLTSGDTIRIFADFYSGTNNSHESENATCTIEYLG